MYKVWISVELHDKTRTNSSLGGCVEENVKRWDLEVSVGSYFRLIDSLCDLPFIGKFIETPGGLFVQATDPLNPERLLLFYTKIEAAKRAVEQ